MSSSSSMILLAGSAIVVAALAAPFVFPIRKKQDDEFITAEEVVKIWDRLFLETQQVVASTAQQLQQLIQMGAIPESQARNIIANGIIDSLPSSQTKVCKEFGVDYDCLEEATWAFMEEGDQKVKNSVERFQALFANFAGNRSFVGKRPTKMTTETTASTDRGATDIDDGEVEQTFTADELILAAQAFFTAATAAAKMVTESARANGVDMQDQAAVQAMVQELGAVTEALTSDALKKFGLTTSSFQATISAQAQDPKIGRALMIVQQEHMKEMQAMGLA